MNLKKMIVSGCVAVAAMAMMVVTASAAPVTYAPCTVENCAAGYVHSHNGVYYSAHHSEDGHNHSQIHTRASANGNYYGGYHNGRHH